MIVKSNICSENIQRIEINELEALSTRMKRAMMYSLDYAIYKYKEEAKELRESMRRGQGNGKKKTEPIKTERSVHAISTPFGGMNKRY